MKKNHMLALTTGALIAFEIGNFAANRKRNVNVGNGSIIENTSIVGEIIGVKTAVFCTLQKNCSSLARSRWETDQNWRGAYVSANSKFHVPDNAREKFATFYNQTTEFFSIICAAAIINFFSNLYSQKLNEFLSGEDKKRGRKTEVFFGDDEK